MEVAKPTLLEPVVNVGSNTSRTRVWIGGIAAAVIAAVAFAFLWASSRSELTRLAEQVATLSAANTELKHNQQDLTETIKELSAALNNATPAASAGFGAPAGGSPGTGSLVRTEVVPYGEVALDR